MEVTYKNNTLRKYAEDEKFSIRKLGARRSDLYIRRIGDLMAQETLEGTRDLPGHFHELTGNRKGQWACDLDQPYRLIIWGAEPDKVVIWAEVTEAEIVEIIDYHK